MREIGALPKEALPKLALLICLIRAEFIGQEPSSVQTTKAINHQRTRRMLATSKRNWAYDSIADRDDRI